MNTRRRFDHIGAAPWAAQNNLSAGNFRSLNLVECSKGKETGLMKQDNGIDLQQMAQSASRASALMKTLGHKDRLMILCHLAEGEKSVGQIAELLEIPQSPLSQHLSRMRKEDLVETRREAQTIFYSLKSGEASRIVEVLYELFCEADGCAI
jgi:DNA-binding transcriptional ArsR family regulator